MEKLIESYWHFEMCTMGCKSSGSQILYPRLLIAYDRTGPDSNPRVQALASYLDVLPARRLQHIVAVTFHHHLMKRALMAPLQGLSLHTCRPECNVRS